ncbi:hypothetical protein BC628DRAFT_52979 [Trametes gibbosa]|nr:hypothetical protein BC628DRAFT_52979 [Trametes gibbosa]
MRGVNELDRVKRTITKACTRAEPPLARASATTLLNAVVIVIVTHHHHTPPPPPPPPPVVVARAASHHPPPHPPSHDARPGALHLRSQISQVARADARRTAYGLEARSSRRGVRSCPSEAARPYMQYIRIRVMVWVTRRARALERLGPCKI